MMDDKEKIVSTL